MADLIMLPDVAINDHSDSTASLSVANPGRVRRYAENVPADPVVGRVAAGSSVPDLAPDRDRIAAALQDQVVSELFSIGLGLEAIAEGLGHGDQARILGYVESLDTTILRIRSTIVQLERHGPSGV